MVLFLALALFQFATLYVVVKRLNRPKSHKLAGAHGLVWCSRCGADEGLFGDCPGARS